MGFKENLKDEISYQGMLIKELAAKAGLSPNSLSNYLKENNSIPTADTAVKIAQALNVTVEYLVTGKKTDICKSQSANYSEDVHKVADKIEKMSPRDRRIVITLVNTITENPYT